MIYRGISLLCLRNFCITSETSCDIPLNSSLLAPYFFVYFYCPGDSVSNNIGNDMWYVVESVFLRLQFIVQETKAKKILFRRKKSIDPCYISFNMSVFASELLYIVTLFTGDLSSHRIDIIRNISSVISYVILIYGYFLSIQSLYKQSQNTCRN